MTPKQLENLTKLAAYLDNVQPEAFDMRRYHNGCRAPSRASYSCGTVACAAGYGPAAGISPSPYSTWTNYIFYSFGIEGISNAFSWVFSPYWGTYDNTPQGAAKRIRYFLEHGVPAMFTFDEFTFDEFSMAKYRAIFGEAA